MEGFVPSRLACGWPRKHTPRENASIRRSSSVAPWADCYSCSVYYCPQSDPCPFNNMLKTWPGNVTSTTSKRLICVGEPKRMNSFEYMERSKQRVFQSKLFSNKPVYLFSGKHNYVTIPHQTAIKIRITMLKIETFPAICSTPTHGVTFLSTGSDTVFTPL